METEAASRRARLLALGAQVKAGESLADKDNGSGNGSDLKRTREDDDASAQIESTPVLKFRNYTPHNEKFKNLTIPKIDVPTVEQEVEKLAKSKEELSKSHEVDLLNLAPKKPNWDLKRDVEKKLEKLDRRTKRAITELIRERILKQEKDGQTAEIAGVVAAHQQDGNDSD